MNPSPSNNPNHDSSDDAFVQQVLQSHFRVPDVDPDYVSQLSEKLDSEFARVAADEVGSVGVSGDQLENRGVYTTLSNGVRVQDDLSKTNKRNRSLPRWLGAMIAASVAVGVLTFWMGQPATSWADMIEALKATPWVQTDAGRTSSWFSASNQMVARRNVDQTVFESRRDGQFFNYVRSDGRVYKGQGPFGRSSDDVPTFERDLLRLLSNSVGFESTDLCQWRVVSESSRMVDRESGRWLELTVVFESDQQPRQTFTTVFTLDPETKLPVESHGRLGVAAGSDSIRARNQDGWQSVSFDYPSVGPESIYDLGVAANTPIESFVGRAGADIARLDVLGDDTTDAPLLATNAAGNKPTASDVRPENIAAGKNDNMAATVDSETQPVVALTPAAQPKLPAAAISRVPIPAASLAMTARVDQLVNQLWREKEVAPVDPATDEAFLRRVYLDVIGRVPTTVEYDQFFQLAETTRRSELIDELLDSREHALHMGGVWKRILVPDDETAISRLGGSEKLEQWLADSFAKNQPYDELVKELLLAKGRVNESGPLLFFAAAKLNAEELAARTSRTFLGMRMECAECHDHPFDHWSQKDFWGLAAYFAQISRPKGKIEMVSPVLRVHDAAFGDVTLPESEIVVAPKLPRGQSAGHTMTAADFDALKDAEIGDSSRRERLVAWLTNPQNSHFSEATVNRIWAHLFGVGLVDPVDDMGGHNQPASPQLLNQLGRYFVQSDFDLRALLRVLLNSRAYQLSSRNTQSDADDLRYFARMHLKPLTAEQLYDCLATATGRTDLGSTVSAVGVDAPVAFAANVGRFSDPGRAAFLAQFRTSIDQRTEYQAGIPQALTLMNGPMIESATSDGPKGILRSLSAPFFDDATRIEKLFVATLSRQPTDEEQKRYAQLLEGNEKTVAKSEMLGDVLWVLLNSAEFTMNH